jgi:hypothetical protein
MGGNRFNHFGSWFQGDLFTVTQPPLATYSSGPPKRLRRPVRPAHGDVNVAPAWLLRHDVTRQGPPTNDPGEAGMPRSFRRMPPLLSARTSLVAVAATIPEFAPAALYGRLWRPKMTLLDPSRKWCPRRRRLRRRIDQCLKSPARVPPISATGPSQIAALYPRQGGVIFNTITVQHQPPSLSLARPRN